MTTTLLDRLTAAIDEAERNARAAAEKAVADWRPGDESVTVVGPHGRLIQRRIDRPDPKVILACYTAERRLIDIAFDHAAQWDRDWGCMHDADQIRAGECAQQQPDTLDIVIALAAAYDLLE